MSEEVNELIKDINDIAEDHREEGESIDDAFKDGNNEKALDDVAEDHREEGESIENLKEQLKNALLDNSMLKSELEKVTKERDDAHRVFLGQSRESEVEKRDYNKLVGDLK